MKLKEKHRNKVEKIKNFSKNNKIFVIMATVAILFVFFNSVNGKNNSVNISETSMSENESITQTASNTSNSNETHLRFYWSDLWILGIGGGFCIIMIIKERKKGKENIE